MDEKRMLGSFEFAIVTAIVRLRDDAYGVRIRQDLDAMLGKTVAIGAVYTTLARLEEKGLISSRVGDPTPERGGRAKRYYALESSGRTALNDTLAAQERLRDAMPPGAVPA